VEELDMAQEESNIYADTRPTGAVEQALAYIEGVVEQWSGDVRIFRAIEDIKEAIAHARRELGLEERR